MGLDRRVIVALSVIALILAPAAVLRLLCAGHSCDEPEGGAANVPFCSLPDDQRKAIVAGFREGRSPDVLTVTGSVTDEQVPILFFGEGFGEVELEPGVGLDQIAPTVARAVDFRRAHPEVRSGTPIPYAPTNTGARLVLIVALKGIGASNFQEWGDYGADVTTTTEATTDSLPIDPTAILTTMGTGGRPSQHGITGHLIRNDAGRLVTAWDRGAPVSVIATLADDFDERSDQKAKIGLVATSPTDQGLVGGNWYIDHDRDVLRYVRGIRDKLDVVRDVLAGGFGRDDVVDVLAVALELPPDRVNSIVPVLLDQARRASGGRFVAAVAGTGASENQSVDVDAIERLIPGRRHLIEGAVPGGFFVDQDALAATGKTEDEVIEAVKETGEFTDVFASITVTFSRYC